MTRLSRLVLAVCLSTFAVGGPAAAQPPSNDPDIKELSSYRLTKPTLDKVVNVNRAMVRAMMQDPRYEAAMKLEAEVEALRSKGALTDEEAERLEELEAKQDEMTDDIDNPLGGDSKTLAEMEARIKKFQPLMQALQKEGLTAREYGKFWMAFIQAAFAQGFQKAGMLKELPPDINPENVRFIEEHAAEIAALQKEFEALERKQ
jgi:septal ring factor EnvC (AmiA/AmiB activator)